MALLQKKNQYVDVVGAASSRDPTLLSPLTLSFRGNAEKSVFCLFYFPLPIVWERVRVRGYLNSLSFPIGFGNDNKKRDSRSAFSIIAT